MSHNRRISIGRGAFFRADLKRKKKNEMLRVSNLALKAREPTVEGFIAFRKYVCFPAFAMELDGIIEENDIRAHKYACPNHHMEWMRAIITGESNKFLLGIAGNHTAILSPRGSAKSTLLTEFLAWTIGIHYTAHIPLKILFISFTLTIARQKSMQIKRIIESKRFAHIFPTVIPSSKWRDDWWEINKEYCGIPDIGEPYTMYCSGITGSITSKRSHLVVFDDLIKSPKDILNPIVREDMVTAVNQVVKPTLFPGGRMLCAGTRMLGEDIYASEFTEEKGWTVIEQSAIMTDDQGNEYSYWEDWFPLEYLKSLRDPPKGDPVAFAFQYQNKIVPVDAISIPPEWIHFVDPLPILEYQSLFIGSDFSSSMKEKSDFTVFHLIGRTEDSSYHVLRTYRERSAGNLIKIQKLLEMLYEVGILDYTEVENDPTGIGRKYRCDHMLYMNWYIENVGAQQSIKLDWDTVVRKGMELTNITPVLCTPKGDKRQRLLAITGGLQLGRICFARTHYTMTSTTVQELLHFGSTYDDCVDALTLGILAAGYRPPLS